MRFYERMLEEAETRTAQGWIVLMPFVTKRESTPVPDAETLDLMHRRKIDMSERIVVVGGPGPEPYIGSSTRGEIAYAGRHGKTIEYV
jgi:hypothetical protein